MKKGKLIVIGGNDGTGKKTQAELLQKKLQHELQTSTVHLRTFPDYSSFWGIMVGRYLGKPEFGDKLPEEICADPLQVAALYELDRRLQVAQMLKWLDVGDWIICDRYGESNLAHQTARISNPDDQESFLDQAIALQRGLGILEPDLTIILTLDNTIRAEQTAKRRGAGLEHGKTSKIDRHEQDLEYMKRVNELYPKLAQRFNWPVISCSDSSNKQKFVDRIHKEIWEIIASRIL